MVSDAWSYLDRARSCSCGPGLAITLMVLAFDLAGDGLRNALDPRTAAEPPG